MRRGGGLLCLSCAGVVALVCVVLFGTAFVPPTLGTPAAFAAGAGTRVAGLQAGLAEGHSFDTQLIAAAAGANPVADKAAGASLDTQIGAWGAGAYLAPAKAALAAMAAALATSGAIPAALAAKAVSALRSAKAWTTSVSGRYDVTALVALAEQVGFRGRGAALAGAVAMAESSGNTLAVLHDSNGTEDLGLWQVNWPTHYGVAGATSPSQLFVPLTNARAAYAISAGGSNWRPWVTYDHGAEIPYLAAAMAAAGL